MKKVLLTGGTGLIGKEAIEPLLESGFKVYAVSSKPGNDRHVEWIKADLLDIEGIPALFKDIRPGYLLHFAWVASGDYLVSESNYRWLDSGMAMLKAFRANGGKRAVYAGTCFEYEFLDTPLKETGKLSPETVYARCKAEMNEKATAYSLEHGLSFGWGRIFYVFGHGEYEKRLVPHVVKSLKEGLEVTISRGLVRDYMYTKDIAAAFVQFLDSGVEGAVNICRGEGVFLESLAGIIAEKLGRKDLLRYSEPVNQPPVITGDNSRLINEIKYSYKFSLEEALEAIL